jgi:nucleoside 2-deoxyribosyltransferase
VKIYLACTVRGDREAVAALRAASARLQAGGHEVLTAHLLRDDVEAAEAMLTEREIYERDIEWLDACDALVADASGSTFGVGFEVGRVLARAPQSGQRVYLLYNAARRGAISRMITGNCDPHCTTFAYASPGELLEFIDNHVVGKDDPPCSAADPDI